MTDWGSLLGIPKDNRKKLRPHESGCMRREGKRGNPEFLACYSARYSRLDLCFVEDMGSQDLSP